MPRAGLRKHLVSDTAKETPPSRWHLLERTLWTFGFVPRGTAVKKMLLHLYSDEFAGLCNDQRKTLYLVPDPGSGAHPHFDEDEQKTTLAHEMTHALADQHFDLHAMHEITKNDDDMNEALSALAATPTRFSSRPTARSQHKGMMPRPVW